MNSTKANFFLTPIRGWTQI